MIGVSRVPRSQEISSSVTRWGIMIGSRVWTRSRRRCGIGASRRPARPGAHRPASSGSPPLRITSWIDAVGAICRKAGCQPSGGVRRRLYRESAGGSSIGNGRRRPQLLPSRLCPGTSAAARARSVASPSPTGSARSPGCSGQFAPSGQHLQQQRVGRRRPGGCGPDTAAARRAENSPAAWLGGQSPSGPAARAGDRVRPGSRTARLSPVGPGPIDLTWVGCNVNRPGR